MTDIDILVQRFHDSVDHGICESLECDDFSFTVCFLGDAESPMKSLMNRMSWSTKGAIAHSTHIARLYEDYAAGR